MYVVRTRHFLIILLHRIQEYGKKRILVHVILPSWLTYGKEIKTCIRKTFISVAHPDNYLSACSPVID